MTIPDMLRRGLCFLLGHRWGAWGRSPLLVSIFYEMRRFQRCGNDEQRLRMPE